MNLTAVLVAASIIIVAIASIALAMATARRRGRSEAIATQLRSEADAAHDVAHAALAGRPDPHALPERLRDPNW